MVSKRVVVSMSVASAEVVAVSSGAGEVSRIVVNWLVPGISDGASALLVGGSDIGLLEVVFRGCGRSSRRFKLQTLLIGFVALNSRSVTLN